MILLRKILAGLLFALAATGVQAQALPGRDYILLDEEIATFRVAGGVITSDD